VKQTTNIFSIHALESLPLRQDLQNGTLILIRGNVSKTVTEPVLVEDWLIVGMLCMILDKRVVVRGNGEI
jgi:hypothetical protein